MVCQRDLSLLQVLCRTPAVGSPRARTLAEALATEAQLASVQTERVNEVNRPGAKVPLFEAKDDAGRGKGELALKYLRRLLALPAYGLTETGLRSLRLAREQRLRRRRKGHREPQEKQDEADAMAT